MDHSFVALTVSAMIIVFIVFSVAPGACISSYVVSSLKGCPDGSFMQVFTHRMLSNEDLS